VPATSPSLAVPRRPSTSTSRRRDPHCLVGLANERRDHRTAEGGHPPPPGNADREPPASPSIAVHGRIHTIDLEKVVRHTRFPAMVRQVDRDPAKAGGPSPSRPVACGNRAPSTVSIPIDLERSLITLPSSRVVTGRLTLELEGVTAVPGWRRTCLPAHRRPIAFRGRHPPIDLEEGRDHTWQSSRLANRSTDHRTAWGAVTPPPSELGPGAPRHTVD